MAIDPVGLVLAGVVPPVIYFGAVYANGYRRATVLAYGKYRKEHDHLLGPCPVCAAAYDPATGGCEHRGAMGCGPGDDGVPG